MSAELGLRLQQLVTYASQLTNRFDALPTTNVEEKDLDFIADLLTTFCTALQLAQLDAAEARRIGSYTVDHQQQLKTARRNAKKWHRKLEFLNAQNTKGALLANASACDVKHGLQQNTPAETMDYGRAVMAETTSSLDRVKELINSSQHIAAATLVKIGDDVKRFERMNEDLVSIDSTLTAANKRIRRIARRMASDKILCCLTIAVIAMIIYICVKKLR